MIISDVVYHLMVFWKPLSHTYRHMDFIHICNAIHYIWTTVLRLLLRKKSEKVFLKWGSSINIYPEQGTHYSVYDSVECKILGLLPIGSFRNAFTAGLYIPIFLKINITLGWNFPNPCLSEMIKFHQSKLYRIYEYVQTRKMI